MLAGNLNPPIQYELIWLIIGLCVSVMIPVWYGWIWWLTRKRPLKTLDNVKQLGTALDIDALKAKYLRMIDEAHAQFTGGKITLRQLHQQLSMIARTFVFEAKHFPAPVLTLSDLEQSPYPLLTHLIQYLYPEEFGVITRADAPTSVEAAKGFIRQWL